MVRDGYLYALALIAAGVLVGWFAPVSYTHLDVYKRQALFVRAWGRMHVTR